MSSSNCCFLTWCKVRLLIRHVLLCLCFSHLRHSDCCFCSPCFVICCGLCWAGAVACPLRWKLRVVTTDHQGIHSVFLNILTGLIYGLFWIIFWVYLRKLYILLFLYMLGFFFSCFNYFKYCCAGPLFPVWVWVVILSVTESKILKSLTDLSNTYFPLQICRVYFMYYICIDL